MKKFFQKNVVDIKKCSIFAPQFQIGISSCSKADFLEQNFAEIAQLVEHDLAKVGVASSSLVFRSDISA